VFCVYGILHDLPQMAAHGCDYFLPGNTWSSKNLGVDRLSYNRSHPTRKSRELFSEKPAFLRYQRYGNHGDVRENREEKDPVLKPFEVLVEAIQLTFRKKVNKASFQESSLNWCEDLFNGVPFRERKCTQQPDKVPHERDLKGLFKGRKIAPSRPYGMNYHWTVEVQDMVAHKKCPSYFRILSALDA